MIKWILIVMIFVFYFWVNVWWMPQLTFEIWNLGIIHISNKVCLEGISTFLLFISIPVLLDKGFKLLFSFFALWILAGLGYSLYYFTYRYFNILNENMPENYSTAIFHFSTNPFLLLLFVSGWLFYKNNKVKEDKAE